MNIYKYKHSKYNFDYILRKCKIILINTLYNFINNKIKEIYNNNDRQLICITSEILSNGKISYNKSLLMKTLIELFSKPTTKKLKFLREYNEKLIEELLNEKDDDKRNYFQNLFNLTFLDCLEHFTNKRVIEELQGLKTFLEIKNDENELKRLRLDDKEYLETIEYHLNHYEEILNKKTRRIRNHT